MTPKERVMVKVIGRDEAAVKRTTCRSCASILEYTLNEVKNFISYDYGDLLVINYYVDCPNCGNKVYTR